MLEKNKIIRWTILLVAAVSIFWLSIVGVRSSCGCLSMQKLPQIIAPHKTEEVELSFAVSLEYSVYDQTAVFIIAESNMMRQYPVRIIAAISAAPKKKP